MTAALSDLKVCDFMWVMAGPAATRMLADFGATIVRIESSARPDPARAVGPHVNDVPGTDSSVLWNNNNAGKRGLALDLANPEASAVVKDLVRWADVVTESFAPGAMDRLGFGYESLRNINPRIIMLSTCLMGQYGDHADLAGFGNLSAAITGFYGLCGWPGRPPAGPFGAYTDYIAPRYVAAAILAAIERRSRSGEGEYIDLAQAEAALHFIAPALLDLALNGRSAEACGNLDLRFSPHGVYPCTGEDWLAIACRTDEHWRGLCNVMVNPALAEDERFATLSLRQKNAPYLDDLISCWSRGVAARDAEALLQAHGVPCSVVQSSAQCAEDAQLNLRNHFVELAHPLVERVTVEGPRFLLSRTPGQVVRPAPVVGEHSREVLSKILGYSMQRIDELYATGAVH